MLGARGQPPASGGLLERESADLLVEHALDLVELGADRLFRLVERFRQVVDRTGSLDRNRWPRGPLSVRCFHVVSVERFAVGGRRGHDDAPLFPLSTAYRKPLTASPSTMSNRANVRLVDFLLVFVNEDFPEDAPLLDGHAAEADQLQHAEKDGDQLVAIAPFEKPLQAERRFLLHLRVELAHLVRHFVDGALQLDRLRMILR